MLGGWRVGVREWIARQAAAYGLFVKCWPSCLCLDREDSRRKTGLHGQEEDRERCRFKEDEDTNFRKERK